MTRRLIFGAMPPDADPARDIPAGAWCFVGQEEGHPAWDERYALPPDPYAQPGDLRAAQALANAVICRTIPLLAEYCDRERGTERGVAFWETALAPWLFTAVHAMVERRQRLLDLIDILGRERLLVPVLPEACSFAFADSLDFKNNGVHSLAFNHWLFSRLLQAEPWPKTAPRTWIQDELPPLVIHRPRQGPVPAKERLRRLLHRLSFPKVKGFSAWQSLAFSLTLLGNRRVRDNTLPLRAYDPSTPVTGVLAARLTEDWMPILVRSLPRAYLELPLPRRTDRRGRIRFMVSEFLYDNALDLHLAAWREGGGRLVDCQHGANDGNLECIGSTVLSYRQHAHLTWGWERHTPYPGNFVPMTHPVPLRTANAHRESDARLILVGTEMSTFTYRLKSRPMSTDMVTYRRDKCRYLADLPVEVRERTMYRPYFAVPAGLADAAYVRLRFPDLPLCQGDLTAAMLGCRLLVLDHFGTTLSVALAANVPLVCWWDQNRWRMGPETQEALEALRSAGILLPDAKTAAARTAELWPDVASWWGSEEVQAARMVWVERYARNRLPAGESLTGHWQKVLAEL